MPGFLRSGHIYTYCIPVLMLFSMPGKSPLNTKFLSVKVSTSVGGESAGCSYRCWPKWIWTSVFESMYGQPRIVLAGSLILVERAYIIVCIGAAGYIGQN